MEGQNNNNNKICILDTQMDSFQTERLL